MTFCSVMILTVRLTCLAREVSYFTAEISRTRGSSQSGLTSGMTGYCGKGRRADNPKRSEFPTGRLVEEEVL